MSLRLEGPVLFKSSVNRVGQCRQRICEALLLMKSEKVGFSWHHGGWGFQDMMKWITKKTVR